MKRFFQKRMKPPLQPIVSEEFNPQIYDHLDSVIKLDMNGKLVSYSHAFAKQYGYNEQDFNKPFLDLFIKFKTYEQKHFFEKAILGKTQKFDAIGRYKNGKTIDINITLIPIKGKTGMDVYVIIKNIEEFREEKEKLIFKKMHDTFNELKNICNFYYDAINDRHYFSKQLPHLLGISNDGKEFSPTLNQLLMYVHDEDRNLVNETIQNALRNKVGYQIEYRILRRDQTVIYVYEHVEIFLDKKGYLDGLIGFIQDITNSKMTDHSLEKIKYLSDYDSLTRLPNRQKFYEKLQKLTDEYAYSKEQFAVMIFDMDRFKYVNDTLGHQVGDELLIQISERLSKHLTSSDMLARHSGDEFGVLIGKMDSIESLKAVADKMVASLKEPFYIKEFQLYVTASIGISVYPENGVTSLELLRNADLALYKSQKRGKNNYKIITQSSSIQSFKSFSIGRDLKKALKNNEMILYFQPRVNAFSNQIISAEALIRWNHPEWGFITPQEFLTIAEENGLITDIDEWVLIEVCNQIKKWKKEHRQSVPISINVSAVNFMKQNWTSTVAKVIQEAGIHPHDLEFEITENLLLNNQVMVNNTINSLGELGIKISLDDFGKGYSSLSYLTQFPFDVIKIDKSFIRNMHESDRDLLIVKSIIHLAKGLKIKVVAEGVETIQQLKILQKEQCNEIQGFLFSRPVPINELETLLESKILPPMDPKLKAKESKRKYDRLQFPNPLEADMRLVSISGRSMQLGKSSVLIEDMSIGGLRYLSNLKLPIRGDVLFQFETEILGKNIQLNGSIVWKEDMNDNLTEYGVKFIIDEDEQSSLASLLHTLNKLLKNSTSLPPYKMVKEDKYQYYM